MKLFVLLESFSSEELRGAKKAVQSPIFNSNKRIELLFDFLRKKHPVFPRTDKFKNEIYTKIYPNGTYNDYKLRRIFSELREVLEDYLLYTKMKTDSFTRDLSITKIYSQRNLSDLFNKKTEQLLKKIDSNPYPDSQMLFFKSVLMKDFFEYQGTMKLKYYEYLVKSMEALHLFYMGERATTKLVYQTLSKTLSLPLKLPLEQELQSLGEDFSETIPLNFLIYQKIWDLVETNEESFYQEVSQSYNENLENFTKPDQRAILRCLINYCIAQFNSGKKQFGDHILDLYDKGLSMKMLLEDDGSISETIYKNMVMLGVQTKKFDWVAKFIEDYGKLIDLSSQQEAKSFSLAYLHFFQKDFSKTIDVLQNIKFTNVNDIISAKSILLRAYFETYLNDQSFYFLFESNAFAFYKYLKRSNISEEKKSRYLKFILFIKKVASEINTQGIQVGIQGWEKELADTSNIAMKEWCRKKLEELKHK